MAYWTQHILNALAWQKECLSGGAFIKAIINNATGDQLPADYLLE